MQRYVDLDLSSPTRAARAFLDALAEDRVLTMLLVCSPRAQQRLARSLNNLEFSEIFRAEYTEWQHLNDAVFPIVQLLADGARRGVLLLDLAAGVAFDVQDGQGKDATTDRVVLPATSNAEGALEFVMVTSPAGRWRVDQVRQAGAAESDLLFIVRDPINPVAVQDEVDIDVDIAALVAKSIFGEMDMATPAASVETFWAAGADGWFDVQQAMFSKSLYQAVCGDLDASRFVDFPEGPALDYDEAAEQYSYEGTMVDFDEHSNVIDATTGAHILQAPPKLVPPEPEHALGGFNFADFLACADEAGLLRFDYRSPLTMGHIDTSENVATVSASNQANGKITLRMTRTGGVWLLDDIALGSALPKQHRPEV